jgi:oxygen-independent coproporphyrinogen-3 oxidase
MVNGAIHNSANNVMATESAATVIRHIYVHIPFCARICPYCAFYKERADPSQTQHFCAALLRELEQCCAQFLVQPQTIFFGGGTPTALTTTQLEYLLNGFRERLNFPTVEEWTMEANPGSISPRKAALLRRLGVNRISLGVQSWNDELLQILGRNHGAAAAETSFHILRDAGFTNLNIDLMFGIPGQNLSDWSATLAKTIALQAEHISAYCLTYEEDTEFFIRHARGELQADSDADAEFFERAMQMLKEAGYEHYEISNYARAGFASRHNRAYWSGEDYLGIGPSAYSTVGLKRWRNLADYRGYSHGLFGGKLIIDSAEILNFDMKRGEKIALSLRTNTGVPAAWLEPWPTERDEFLALGLLAEVGGRLILTPGGKMLADSVAEAFV